MRPDGRELLKRYLDKAISAERGCEIQLRDFAKAGDDDEVQAAFETDAAAALLQRERLTGRLRELGPQPGDIHTETDALQDLAPKIASPENSIEERTLQALISAYTAAAGGFARYEFLGLIARRAGDSGTEHLARQIQAEKRTAAERIWHFLPSRSKIAFNMLTVSEVDPAVETKVADNRLMES
ncbi:MAG: DUF892 family protein [Acidobacteriota bacterium]|nr:DUF892 family protein [Acidobacteriota bacterium]